MKKTCFEYCCACYDPKLDKLSYQSKFKLDKLSHDKIKKLFYNFTCEKDYQIKINKLNKYLSLIDHEFWIIYNGGEPCLDCNQLQCLAEKIRRLSIECNIQYRKDLQIDDSNLNLWVANNPFCVAREKYEKLAYEVFCELKLEYELRQITCDLDVDIISKEKACELTFEIISNALPCDIIVAIKAYKQNCDLDFKVSRNKQECKIDFKLLNEKVNCDLDLNTYISLVDCNLSFDVIKTIYENGCTVTLTEDGPVISSILNSYPLNSFIFDGEPDFSILKKLGVDVSKSKYFKDPQGFIDNLNSDYKLER